MMSPELQYGALGLLAAVLAAQFGLARAIVVPLMRDVLATNRALREAMVSMGQRISTVQLDLNNMGEAVNDLRRELVKEMAQTRLEYVTRRDTTPPNGEDGNQP